MALFEEIERRVASIPGVALVAVANEFPLRGGGQSRVTLAGDAATGDDSVRRAGFQAVSPGYFATLRIPLVRGRLLAAGDGPVRRRPPSSTRRSCAASSPAAMQSASVSASLRSVSTRPN